MFSRTCAVVPRRSMWIGIYLFVCQCTYPHGYGCEGRRHRFKYASRIPMFLIAGPPVGLSCPRPSQLRAPEGTFQPWPSGKLLPSEGGKAAVSPKNAGTFWGVAPAAAGPRAAPNGECRANAVPEAISPVEGQGRGTEDPGVPPPCTTLD